MINETFENRLIEELKQFFLSLEKGFMLAARKESIRVDQTEQSIDLVFYNKFLHAYLLAVLETEKSGLEQREKALNGLRQALNYYAEYVNDLEDQPPLGLLVCLDKESERVSVDYILSDSSSFNLDDLSILPKEDLLHTLIVFTLHSWKRDEESRKCFKPLNGKHN